MHHAAMSVRFPSRIWCRPLALWGMGEALWHLRGVGERET